MLITHFFYPWYFNISKLCSIKTQLHNTVYYVMYFDFIIF